MGVSASKKFVGRLSGYVRAVSSDDRTNEPHIKTDPREVETDCSSYLVTTRRSSQYLDEDGFLAHEFWEVNSHRTRSEPAMKRIVNNIRPQGEIPYEHPRLKQEYPYVLAENCKELTHKSCN